MSSKNIPVFKIMIHPDKGKVLKNGKAPIVIRATYKRKRKYIYLGLSGIAENWNAELSLFQRNGNRLSEEEKNGNILLQKHLLCVKENEIYFSENEFTFKRFEERFFGLHLKGDVFQFIEDFIQELIGQARIGSALTYGHTLRRLTKYRKARSFSFAEMDDDFIKDFEAFLRNNGNKTNTVGLHMRNLRSIYNQAIKKKLAKAESYPFSSYKIRTQATMKRSLTDLEIQRLLKYQSPISKINDSINAFFFSYFSFGMNIQDIARLRFNNIERGFIIYRRKKTGTIFKIPINDYLAKIILKYEGQNPPFIFPVISENMNPLNERQKIHEWRKKINEDLKTVAGLQSLPKELSIYWARHSAATQLQRKKISTSMISQALGHATEKTTKIYLAGFGDEVMGEIQKLL